MAYKMTVDDLRAMASKSVAVASAAPPTETNDQAHLIAHSHFLSVAILSAASAICERLEAIDHRIEGLDEGLDEIDRTLDDLGASLKRIADEYIHPEAPNT